MRRPVVPWSRICSLVALWGLAVAQPVLDLFGRNPEIFVAGELSPLEIVLFGIAVVVIGPAVLIGVEVLTSATVPTGLRAVHAVLVGFLGSLLGFVVLEKAAIGDAAVVTGAALLVGGTVAYLEATVTGVQTLLRYLAAAPVLFLIVFLGFSPTAELLRQPRTVDVEPGRVGAPAPVVVLSLDELPLASLLRVDGTINAERFPNFARLAAGSTWYRTATSASAFTTESVPATFSGRLPTGSDLPTYVDHPRTLYTLLGSGYDIEVREQVTQLCPPDRCGGRGLLDVSSSRLRAVLADATVVFGHLAVPESWRDGLPAIDRSWGGFVDGAGSPTTPADVGSASTGQGNDLGPDPTCPDVELWCGPARVAELIDTIDRDDPLTLYAVHATVPHIPWILSQSGQQYAPRGVADQADPGFDWPADPVPIRLAFQRHLLQVGAADVLVGRLLDRLQGEGLWEQALVVVVADHGVSFTPGTGLRGPEPVTDHEVYNVPLFIKAPGQTEGAVTDRNARTIDVLPTIIDLLDITTPWVFDGTSLAFGGAPVDKPVVVAGQVRTLTAGLEPVLDVVRRNQEYLPYGDDWLAVSAVGSLGDLVGRTVDELDTTPAVAGRFSVDAADALADWRPSGDGLAPLLIEGRFEWESPVPSEALVALNGTVAGVAVGLAPVAEGDGIGFQALVAEELLREGSNQVELLVPTASGRSFLRYRPS